MQLGWKTLWMAMSLDYGVGHLDKKGRAVWEGAGGGGRLSNPPPIWGFGDSHSTLGEGHRHRPGPRPCRGRQGGRACSPAWGRSPLAAAAGGRAPGRSPRPGPVPAAATTLRKEHSRNKKNMANKAQPRWCVTRCFAFWGALGHWRIQKCTHPPGIDFGAQIITLCRAPNTATQPKSHQMHLKIT